MCGIYIYKYEIERDLMGWTRGTYVSLGDLKVRGYWKTVVNQRVDEKLYRN
jgi:hypothetical protein